MSHFLSTHEPFEEKEISVDVSFIRKYLNILIGSPIEIKLIEFYSLRTTNENSTISKFTDYIFNKIKREQDPKTDRHSIVTRYIDEKIYTDTIFKILTILDALVIRESDSEAMDANFVSFDIVSSDKIIAVFVVKY